MIQIGGKSVRIGGLPETAYVRRNQDILPAIERVGGAPVIIKLIEGTQGVGVVLAETAKVAQAIVEMHEAVLGKTLLVTQTLDAKQAPPIPCYNVALLGNHVCAEDAKLCVTDLMKDDKQKRKRTSANWLHLNAGKLNLPVFLVPEP